MAHYTASGLVFEHAIRYLQRMIKPSRFPMLPKEIQFRFEINSGLWLRGNGTQRYEVAPYLFDRFGTLAVHGVQAIWLNRTLPAGAWAFPTRPWTIPAEWVFAADQTGMRKITVKAIFGANPTVQGFRCTRKHEKNKGQGTRSSYLVSRSFWRRRAIKRYSD